MERFFEFALNHPLLVGTFFTLIILFFLLENIRSGKKVAPQQVGLLANNQGASIIDLRDPKDFKEGHISGSKNIPFSRLKDNLDELKAQTNPIIMVCKMGTVAGSAVQQIGHQNAYRLDGGILNWKSQGLPLVQDKANKSSKKKRTKKA